MTPAAEPRARPFCADVSCALEEPLAGTASRVDHWLLVEYRGAWGKDAPRTSALGDDVRAHLREHIAAVPRSRLLFIRQAARRAAPGRVVFAASSRPGAEHLTRLEIEEEAGLLELDLAAALRGDTRDGAPVHEPLFLVCAHGRHDRCCARAGRPLYDALRHAVDPALVWKSTHVGGDRFAGNVVVLPHGLYYGRVSPGDVPGLLATHAEGRVDLELLRGRSVLTFAEQAAEHAVRVVTGLTGIGDVHLLETHADGATVCRFRLPDGTTTEVEVEATRAGEPRYLTCSSDDPRQPLRFSVRRRS
jgi:hypothetical protein